MYKIFNLKFKIFSMFILIYTLLLSISVVDKNARIKFILNEEIQNLETHYKIIQNYFFVDASSIKEVLQKDSKVIEIFSKAQTASKEQKDLLREELFNYLTPIYNRVSKRGVSQFHFVFPNNRSFLRMHNSDIYGDDLTNIRYSFVYANKEQKDIWGFEQGKCTHNFRYVFPFYDEQNRHIGAVETSLSVEFIQNKLINISKLHSHFLVKKKMVDAKYLSSKYAQSIEHKDYLFRVIDTQYTEKIDKVEINFLEPLKDAIDKKVSLKKPFALYKNIDKTTKVVTFLPIKNIKDKKIVAYLVSYTDNNNIYEIYFHFKVFIVTMFFVFVFLSYFAYINLKRKDELKELANRDQLTNLYNRRYFYNVVQNIISLAKRESKELSVLMIDIDKFKNINDSYGHAKGDIVIKSLASILLEHTRDSDIVSRVGGEEFVILLTNTSKDTAFKVANKIREFTEQQSIKIDNKRDINFTISIGVDSVNIKDEKYIDEALSRADKALYKAKDGGRNRVC